MFSGHADLNYLEEMAGGPDLTVATLPKSGKIVLLQVSECYISAPSHCLLRFSHSLSLHTPSPLYLHTHTHTHTQMDSRLHADNLEKVLNIAVKGSSQVHTILDGVVKENLKKSAASFVF